MANSKNTEGSSGSSPTQATGNTTLIEERRQYAADTLRRSSLASDPIAQFSEWLVNARTAKLIDATAMAISTVSKNGQPHTRMVLLKQFDHKGFVWYTDQTSAKACQLNENPRACILFFWRELERQIRIEGSVTKLAATEADNYFYSRPEGSRFSAAASNQSTVVANRQQLEERVSELHSAFPDGNVPRPEHWGGYSLVPDYYEFWQGRNDRLHDRFSYRKDGSGWLIDRLSP